MEHSYKLGDIWGKRGLTNDQDEENGLEEDENHVGVDEGQHGDPEDGRQGAVHHWPGQLLHRVDTPLPGGQITLITHESMCYMG